MSQVRSNNGVIWGMRAELLTLLLVCFAIPLRAHMLDELSVKTRILVKRNTIAIRLEIAPGVMIAEYFLQILDPGETTRITKFGKRAFLGYVIGNMIFRLNGQKMEPVCREIEAPPFSELITGVGTIYVDCEIPVKSPFREGDTVFYKNRLEGNIALYSLHIRGDNGDRIRILSEERDEITQESVSFRVGLNAKSWSGHQEDENRKPVPDFSGKNNSDMKILIRCLRSGNDPPMGGGVVLLVLATVAGFLHAFTPGHGKALVGAYLVANRGRFIHAVQLGLIVSLTHTISVYLLGGLSLTATYFFLPSKIVPVLTVFSGILVIGIGVFSFINRGMRSENDHVYLLPNFSIFRRKSVNILIDGSAAEAIEYLTLASENECVQNSLTAVGAEEITICSAGCDSHRKHWVKVFDKRQQIKLLEKTFRTGAVDAFVSQKRKTLKKIDSLLRKNGGETFYPPREEREAERILMKIVERFKKERSFSLPKTEMTWRDLLSLGFVGGVVPCPEALAILLVAVSLARILPGLLVVLFFSIGLSLALVMTGVMIVALGNLTIYSGSAGRVMGYVPYVTALFLTGLGLYIVINAI